MKKLLISTLAVGALFAAPSVEELQMQLQKQMEIIQNLQKQIQELKKSQTETKSLKEEVQQIKEMAVENQQKVNPIVANNHLFWSFDLKSNYDFIQYKLSNGDKKTNNVLSNRARLTAVAKPSDNLKATLQVEANNIFGMNGNNNMNVLGWDNSAWTASETPDDTNLRVSQAFFNYHFGPENALMFSAGRRPATEGFPANLRENDSPNSPLAHLINMEFDGFSFKVGNEIFSNMSESFSDWGTWIKFCAGRGYSSNTGKFSQYPYSKNHLKINDFAGMIIVPYDDGQYSLWAEIVKAWNVKGMYDTDGDMIPDTMDDAGNYFGLNAIFKAAGIGDEISDFLDDTTAFVSFAMSKTSPKAGKTMLGTSDNKTGTSIWIGADMPGFADSDRFGVNFVHGSKYWRNMTYGEDTLIGSIAATRGNAYEVYYHHQIIPHLTAGLRATLIDYDYTGSNAFFGEDGTPIDVDDMPTAVDKATDIRAYIRYNF